MELRRRRSILLRQTFESYRQRLGTHILVRIHQSIQPLRARRLQRYLSVSANHPARLGRQFSARQGPVRCVRSSARVSAGESRQPGFVQSHQQRHHEPSGRHGGRSNVPAFQRFSSPHSTGLNRFPGANISVQIRDGTFQFVRRWK